MSSYSHDNFENDSVTLGDVSAPSYVKFYALECMLDEYALEPIISDLVQKFPGAFDNLSTDQHKFVLLEQLMRRLVNRPELISPAYDVILNEWLSEWSKHHHHSVSYIFSDHRAVSTNIPLSNDDESCFGSNWKALKIFDKWIAIPELVDSDKTPDRKWVENCFFLDVQFSKLTAHHDSNTALEGTNAT